VNCAPIPETLIESELFGHLPGSFSGDGAKGKRGRIQEADGGTPFLDEIGDMALALQARLLRVLAEREVLPVGATRPVRVDIRVVAATHHDLEALVRERRFRDDLFYRLAGAHLQRPPLRARRDLPWLVQTMLEQQQPSQPPVRLSPDAQAGLARRKAARRVGSAAQRRGVSVPLPRDLDAGQCPLP
jgi:transcriptional regulator with PAS, ATPase and Fis domain